MYSLVWWSLMWRPGKSSILVLERIDTSPNPDRPPNATPEGVRLRSGYALPSTHTLRLVLILIDADSHPDCRSPVKSPLEHLVMTSPA
jgi:hypothetical protein